MLIITDHEGVTYFAKNGFWSKECYLLTDLSRKQLKWVNRISYLLIFSLLTLTVMFENLLILIVGIVLVIYLEHVITKFIIKNCEKTRRRITYCEAVIEATKKSSQLVLIFTAIAFSFFSWLVIEDIISGKEEFLTGCLILVFFLFMTHFLLYAIYLKRHPPTFKGS